MVIRKAFSCYLQTDGKKYFITKKIPYWKEITKEFYEELLKHIDYEKTTI